LNVVTTIAESNQNSRERLFYVVMAFFACAYWVVSEY
jgi:hypothetical protein